ncbi:Rv1733c family protein [Streptomyces griseoaurantiacus]|uniref:Rv1733c family protein n=1 Tax=Streptomyces griseoaurantiacus TaxID=68213 RepID=UPI00380077EB
MRRAGITRQYLWRWRHNPLRRREDVLEAWILLIVGLMIVVVGPAAGVLAAGAGAHLAEQQRAERHPITATLTRDATGGAVTAGTTSRHTGAPVRWTASDGTRHVGTASVDKTLKAGSQVKLWTDRQDHLTAPPPTTAEVGIEAGAVGTTSALAVVVASTTGYFGVRAVLNRRRLAAWESEWKELGPQQGRRAG